MATVGGESFFKNGIDRDIRRKPSHETGCSVLLYLALLIQVIMSVIILDSKNAEAPSYSGCLGTMVAARYFPNGTASNLCFSQSLYREWQEQGCQRFIVSGWQPQVIDPPKNTWHFLQTYPSVPIVLLGSVGVLALLWFCCQLRATKATIWGAIVTVVLLLAVNFILCVSEFGAINWACMLGVVGIVAGALVLRPKIGDTAVIMSTAMEGLCSNAYVFAVGFALQAVWVAYLALWIASVVGMHLVYEVAQVNGKCVLRTNALSSLVRILYFVLCFYWLTAFLQNSTLIPVAASVGGWYFQQPNLHTLRSALQWSFWNQAGGNAIASAIMGFTEHLLSSISSCWRLCFSLLMPWNWILICLAFVLKPMLQTYGKFGLIAMTFSGKTFSESASKGFELLKASLGDAVLMDHTCQGVMGFATYIISLCVFFTCWPWADFLQNIPRSFNFGYGLPLAIALYCPLLSLFIVVIIEHILDGVDDWEDPDDRAELNSMLVSLFLGAISSFILTNVSKFVVGAMDTIFFCFAIEQTKGANQDRFKEFYASIKNYAIINPYLCQGSVASDTVVVGEAAASPPPQDPRGSAPAPAQVVGQPASG